MKIITLIILSLCSTISFAANYKHVLNGATGSSLFFPSSSSSLQSTLSATIGYDRILNDSWQFGTIATASFSNVSFVTVMIGPTYNFSKNITSSYFTSVYTGVSYSSTIGTTSDLLLYGTFGKRFELSSNITFNPSISVTVTPAILNKTNFSINIFNLSLYL